MDVINPYRTGVCQLSANVHKSKESLHLHFIDALLNCHSVYIVTRVKMLIMERRDLI